MKKRYVITVMLSMTLILMMSLPVMAESLPSFSGGETVTWAKKNLIRNGKLNWTEDCTEYARMCLEAGGVPRDSSKKEGYDPGEYAAYLVDNGYADKIEDLTLGKYTNLSGQTVITLPVKGNEGKVAPGDLLISVCQNPDCPEPECHASIIAGKSGNSWYRYQHASHETSSFQGYGEVRSARCYHCNLNDPSKIKFVCYHIKSKSNGYPDYEARVTGVTVKSAAYNKLKVTWASKSSATAGYNVFFKDASKPQYRLAGHVPAGKTKYIFKVEDKTRYGQDVSFYVRPCRKGTGKGTSADVGSMSKIVKGHTLPGMPKNVKGKRLSSNKIKVTWKKGAGMNGARVEWRYKGTSRWYYGGTLTKTSFTKGGLQKNKKIEVRIKPYLKSTKGGMVYREEYKNVTIK